MEEEFRPSEASPEPLKSLGPFVILGYLLTRPPVLAVVRALIWVALLIIRPTAMLIRAIRNWLRLKARPARGPREAADSL